MLVYLVNEQTMAYTVPYSVPEIPEEIAVDPNERYMYPSVPHMKIAPPDTSEHQIAVAKDIGTQIESWEIKSNYVGFSYWLPDRSYHTINEIGIEPPENAITDPSLLPIIQITGSQMVRQLILDGKDELIQSAIEAVSDITARKLLKARYDREPVVKTNDSDLTNLISSVGYNTPELLQDFFESAAQL